MTESFDFSAYADEAERATYDPADDKLRIYTDFVPRELYDALKGLGFGRAPKQGCFFQVWSPTREDAAVALCGEIEDEDSTLLDRAEERSQRFAGYSANAELRAEQAIKAGNDAVAGIPFGQPILVGHHSERRHRKAVERAQREADKVVEEVDRRDYWEWRARASLRHAQHTFDRGKTLRRVKKLESDLRKNKKEQDEARDLLTCWKADGLTLERAVAIANYDFIHWKNEGNTMTLWTALHDGKITPEEARDKAVGVHERVIKYRQRWIDHLEGLIGYWKAVLEEKHGVDVDDQLPLSVGGWVRCAYGWGQVVRVNKGAEKRITSVSISRETVKATRPGGWFPRIVDYDRILEFSPTEPVAEFKVDPTPHATVKKPDELRQAAEAQAEAAKAVEVKVNWNPDYFPTPLDVVETMLNEVAVALGDGKKMLEPSAGDGRIIEAVIRRYGEPLPDQGVTPFWCEVNSTAIETLKAKNLGGLQIGTDFLDIEPDPVYDAVVMNPPFSRGQAKKHVQHAFDFLKPGGVLVTLLPGQARYHSAQDPFSAWARERFSGSYDLPDGTFKDAGTNVAAHVLVLRQENGYEQGRLL